MFLSFKLYTIPVRGHYVELSALCTVSNAVKELSEHDSIDFLQAEPCAEFSVLLGAFIAEGDFLSFFNTVPLHSLKYNSQRLNRRNRG